MKKYILCFVLCFVSFSLFAGGGKENATSKYGTGTKEVGMQYENGGVLENIPQILKDNTEALKDSDPVYEQQRREAEEAKKEKDKWTKMLNESSYYTNGLTRSLRKGIDNIMGMMETLLFSPLSTTRERIHNDGTKETVKMASTGGVILRFATAIFLIISCLYYAIKIVTDDKFQKQEIPYLIMRVALVFIIWAFLPDIVVGLKNLMWRFAEVVTGTQKGVMSYSTAIQGAGGKSFWALVGLGSALFISSFFGVSAFASIDLTPLSSLSMALYSFAFFGIIATLKITLTYCTWILELYIAPIALILLLPSMLFKGFEYKFISIAKFFFVNALEIFVGGVLILLSLRWNIEVDESSNIFIMMLSSLVKPLFLIVFLPVVSKIIGALTSGGGLADSNNAVAGAVGTLVKSSGIGAIGGALAKGGGGLSQMVQNNQNRQAFNRAFENARNADPSLKKRDFMRQMQDAQWSRQHSVSSGSGESKGSGVGGEGGNGSGLT